MASNAKFEVKIYGDTLEFENSLKGVNSAMSKLQGEASNLRKQLRLNPSDMGAMKDLQANLQKQLAMSKKKAQELKEELANVDKSTPKGQERWTKLQSDLAKNSLKAQYLEKDLAEVGEAISRGNWKADVDTKPAQASLEKVKKSFSVLKEVGIGALRSIGSSITGAVGNGLRGWVSDALATQKAMLSLQNTMEFKGIGNGFQKLQSQMAKLATDTNANTEDTLKLATTFVGLGDSAETAGKKTTNLVKANQAFGGTGENLKGVVQAYGQMSAAGKVTAENINQLTDNNTALGSALKSTVMEMNPALAQYSSFAEASEDGAISVGMLDKAMEKLGKAGGNQITTIGDAWDSFNETMSLALLPTLQALTPVITALIDKMAGWGQIAGDAIGGIVQYVQLLFYQLKDNGAITQFAGAWQNIKVILKLVMGIIGQLIQAFFKVDKESLKNKTSMEQVAITIKAISGAIMDTTAKIAIFLAKLSQNESAMDALKVAIVALSGAMTALKVAKVVSGLNGMFKAVKGGIGGIKTFSGIIKEAGNFSEFVGGLRNAGGAFKALSAVLSINPYVAIAVAIGAVVSALVYFFTQTKKGREVWANFVNFLKQSVENIKSFFSGLGTWFSNLWSGIVNAVKPIWNGVVAVFQFYVNSYKQIFTALITFFTTLWTTITGGITTAWNGVTEFFTGLFNGIKNIVVTVFTAIQTAVTTAYNWFVTTFQPLISFWQAIFNLVGSIVNLAFQIVLAVIRGAYTLVVNAWQGLVAWWNGIFSAVQSVALKAMDAVVGFAKWAWNGLVGIWNAVAGFFGGIFNAVAGVVQTGFNQVVSFARWAWGGLVGIWNAVSGFFSGIFSSVANVVQGAFNRVASFASNAWSRISGVFAPIASWFGGIFGSVSRVVGDVFGQFGSWASNAFNAITGVFNGIGQFFSNIFGGIKRTIDNTLGGVTDVINNISGAINGISGKISGLFKGSLVSVEMNQVSMGALGSTGMVQNSVSGDRINNNTFNINATGNATEIARAVRKEFERGRA